MKPLCPLTPALSHDGGEGAGKRMKRFKSEFRDYGKLSNGNGMRDVKYNKNGD